MSINFVLSILAISVFTDDSILANANCQSIAVRESTCSHALPACGSLRALSSLSFFLFLFARSSFCFPFIFVCLVVSLQLLNYFN